MIRKKKLAFNILNFTDGELAGVGVFTKNLIQVSISEILKNFHVYFHSSSSINAQEVFDIPSGSGVSFQTFGTRSVFLRIFYEQFVLPFKLLGTDVYFSPSPVLPFLLRILNPKCRCIITVHDMIPFFVPQKYGRFRSLYVKALSKYGARYAHLTITVSQNSKRDICTIAKVSPEKVKVIYNFIPTRKSAGVQHENYFLAISTIEPGKNIEGTIAAFARARNHPLLKDFKFYWVGKLGWGYTKAGLMELVNSFGLRDHFVLMGYVSNEKKDQLLRDCTAMVYLSHYEGFGLPVLEALNWLKPAVVSNSSSLPEVVGPAGVVCDKKDVEQIATALLEVVLNRPKYIMEIPAQLHKFSPEQQANNFLELINQELLLTNKGSI